MFSSKIFATSTATIPLRFGKSNQITSVYGLFCIIPNHFESLYVSLKKFYSVDRFHIEQINCKNFGFLHTLLHIVTILRAAPRSSTTVSFFGIENFKISSSLKTALDLYPSFCSQCPIVSIHFIYMCNTSSISKV